MLVSIVLMATLAIGGMGEQPVVVAIDRHSVGPELYGYKGLLVSPETLLIVLPFEESRMLEAGIMRIDYLPDQPLWMVKRDKDSIARIAPEIVFWENQNLFIISASDSQLNDLMSDGVFVMPAEFVPVSMILSPPFGKGLIDKLCNAVDRVDRWQRAKEIASSVDTVRVKANLDFLCRDLETAEPSARYSCRDEIKEIYAPFIRDKLEEYLSPRGGVVDTMMFRIDQCGERDLINITASKPGSLTSASYLICAHYDATASSEPGWKWQTDPSPGADDNASGVIAVLEIARIIGSVDLDVGVKFVAFCGEEQGLRGSCDYVRRLTERDSIIGVINFDMIGWVEGDKAAVVYYDWKSGWLAELFEEARDSLAITDLNLRSELQEIASMSDHASFSNYGIPSIWINEDAQYPYYHTKSDTAGNVNIQQVCDIVKLTSGLLGFFISEEAEGLCDLVLDQANIDLDWEDKTFGRQISVGDTITARIRAINLGPAMETQEPYLFEIWDGQRYEGKVIIRDTIDVQLASGMTTEIGHSWEIQGSYGRRTFTFVLLPQNQDVEEDLNDNVASVSLLVSTGEELLLTDLHVFPNPVTDGGIKIGFILLYSGQSLFGRLDISIFDITGRLMAQKSLERSGTGQDFVIGENTVDLSDVISVRDLSPGIYYVNASVRSFTIGQGSQRSDAKAIFAVAR